MVKEELYINGECVELLESLNPNLTFNIADIANPDQRKADFSKTITLPASKKINKIFEHIFDVNIDLQTFNPNLRTDVTYLVNGEVQLDGYLQIKSVNNKDGLITYSCVIIGRIGNFFTALQEQELTDLDLSSLNHTYTKANQVATWNLPLTTDYCYPMINYDINYGGLAFTETWEVEDFNPAVKAKKYLDEIFSSIGYSYTSTFLTSDYFNTLIVPFSSKEFKLTESTINNRVFSAFNSKVAQTTTAFTTETSGSLVGMGTTNYDTNQIVPQTESYDAGNVYNNFMGVYTVNGTGRYNINAMLKLQGLFTAPSATPTAGSNYFSICGFHGYVSLNRYTSGGVFINTLDSQNFVISPGSDAVAPGATVTTTNTPVNTADPTTTQNNYFTGSLRSPGYIEVDGYSNSSPPNKYFISANNVRLNHGEKLKLELLFTCRSTDAYGTIIPFYQSNVFWRDSANNTYDAATNSFKLKISDSYFNNEVVNSGYAESDNIDMNSVIPAKVKQKDFVKSIIKMFNLYIQPDPADEKNLLIEPRDDFYNNEVTDWSAKLDKSQAVESKPMGALNYKDYLYSYKQDNDYYNELYYNTWDEVYGQADFSINNDFLKTQHKTELIFSPTPSVGQLWYDRVIPTIIKYDDKDGIQRTEANIRILQWAGLKDTDQNWLHNDSSGSTFKTQYPYAGMYDDPYSPGEDLGFNLTNEIYWANAFNNVITFNNTNLYNKFYKKFIEEITDPNSKIVNAYFYLTPSDIANLSFKKQYYFEGQYFRLNKVENYNPSNPLTKCEFLKIKEATVFSRSTVASHGGINLKLDGQKVPTFGNGNGTATNGNSTGNQSVNAIGTNNYISGTVQGATIRGSNNTVQSGATNIDIKGDGNTVSSGVKNVQLINSNNQTVTQSNVVYVNDEIQGAGSFETVSADFTPSENVRTYLVDTQGGSVDAVFEATYETANGLPHIGKIWTFKKLHSTNQVVIDASQINATIDGNTTHTLTNNGDSVTMMWDGQQFNII